MEINLVKLFKDWTQPEYKLHIQFKKFTGNHIKEYSKATGKSCVPGNKPECEESLLVSMETNQEQGT